MTQRLMLEASALFGSDTVARALALDLAAIPDAGELAEQVATAARELREARTPERQRAYVQALPEKVRLLLARWILDGSTAAELTRRLAV